MGKKFLKMPGLIDTHVHFRDPGGTQKEDYFTGSRAAIAGGFTTVLDMPNNPQPTITLSALRQKINSAKKNALCRIYFYFGADQNNLSESSKVKNLVKGLKIYMDHTTGPLLIESLNILENHFRLWPKRLPILVHAEDATILKAILLAQVYQKRLHLCHITQASELEIVRWAKKKGYKITCEVTPHHLFLNKSNEKELGPLGMMRPPLRTKEDNKALWQVLNEGLIDIIATDHAPHTLEEKKSANPPNGVPGLETALPLLLTAVSQKRISLNLIEKLLYENPRKIFAIEPSKNTFIEVDLNEKWEIKNENLYTKCGWTPFAGFKVQGRLKRVVFQRREVFKNGKFNH